jgi:hypothetical protein
MDLIKNAAAWEMGQYVVLGVGSFTAAIEADTMQSVAGMVKAHCPEGAGLVNNMNALIRGQSYDCAVAALGVAYPSWPEEAIASFSKRRDLIILELVELVTGQTWNTQFMDLLQYIVDIKLEFLTIISGSMETPVAKRVLEILDDN